MTRNKQILVCAIALAVLAAQASAQVVDLDQLPWSLDSETAVFDGKTATYLYTGLRFSQGNISIESDEGRATNGTENNRELQFSGNVVIVVDDGRIECENANLQFAGSTLSSAVVTGSPATYELQRAAADDVTRAEAGRLKYDVAAGVIEFSEEATITESGNQISSNYLLYNINERRIKADSSGSDDDRVRITYTPATEDEEASQDDENQ
jgi:lipopolysaccharide export system protein LptA